MSPVNSASPTDPQDAHSAGAPSAPGFSPADERLEMQIESTRQALLGAKTKVIQRELAEEMKRLIKQRSPWAIAVMERECGLR
jgi:hypothetical protein